MAARPLLFTEFCRVLRVVLEPGQLVLAKVAFDGLEPRDLRGEEREIARQLFGPDVEVIPASARRTLVLVIGGRSGKTYIFIALRCLHLALTVPLDTLAPGETACANIIAPDLGLAEQALGYVRGAVNLHPKLKDMAVDGDDEDSKSRSLVIRRDGGSKVSIVCRAASGKGRTGRGRSLVGFGMDEAAIFYDSDHVVNDEEVFKANAPRVMMGGQGIVASTPWAETGLLYELYKANWNRPTTCMVAHAPTRLMRTNAAILEIVANEERRDAENAAREFGAGFMKGGSSQFFDGACIDKSLTVPSELGLLPLPGDEVASGADWGFTRNSSALCIVHQRAGEYWVRIVEEWKPEPGMPLKPSEVCKHFAGVIKEHRGDSVMADGHYRESCAEHLGNENVGLVDAPAGNEGKSKTFVRVRSLMREGRVHLPDHPRLLRQLRAFKQRPLSGGGLSITAPEAADGSHADLASALVLAICQAAGTEVEAPPPPAGTREALERQAREHEERLAREAERPRAWWEEDNGGLEWAS